MRFRRKLREVVVSEQVSETVTRLERLADHLQDTAQALEELVRSMKEEEAEGSGYTEAIT